MVERNALPRGRSVAHGALGGKSACGMIRVHGRLEAVQVTRSTVLARSGEAVIHMALATRCSRVLARQCKFRRRVVIESGACPLIRRMAHGAVLWESAGRVRWVERF